MKKIFNNTQKKKVSTEDNFKDGLKKLTSGKIHSLKNSAKEK